MTPRAAPPERPLRRWHRRLGWLVGPWLVLMAATGLLLAGWPEPGAGIDAQTGQRLPRPGAAAYDGVHALHSTLAWPVTGAGVTAVLGVLAVVALAFGLRLGWPRRWRDTLVPPQAFSLRARWFGWHRAAGWWVLVLLLPVAASGALLAASELLPGWGGARTVPEASTAVQPDAAAIAAAVDAARGRAPGERLQRVRLHPGVVEVAMRGRWGLAAGQDRRLWFDAAQARLLREDPPEAAPAFERLLGAAFALHGGRWAGAVAVPLAALIALGTAGLALSGLRLWWLRRKPA